jgi:polyphenol oxidase
MQPDWDAPGGVRALMTTREGGVSTGRYASLNLSRAVGDDAQAVAENWRRVRDWIGVDPFVPRLVHGAAVVGIDATALGRPRPEADACWSRDPAVACAVTAADCLPVLFASEDGRVVAAAHAGWRGLAAGVLERTVQALVELGGAEAEGLHVWLGPCIGPRRYEVGVDVLQALGAAPLRPGPAFVASPREDGAMRWLADLPSLARERLLAAGVRRISGGDHCTASDAERFFSFRRDGVTGRMLAAVACRG